MDAGGMPQTLLATHATTIPICKQMATLQTRQTHTCKCLLLGIVWLIFLAKLQAKFTNLQSKAQAAIVAALDGICVLGGAYNRNANFAFCWQATQTSVLYIYVNILCEPMCMCMCVCLLVLRLRKSQPA